MNHHHLLVPHFNGLLTDGFFYIIKNRQSLAIVGKFL